MVEQIDLSTLQNKVKGSYFLYIKASSQIPVLGWTGLVGHGILKAESKYIFHALVPIYECQCLLNLLV